MASESQNHLSRGHRADIVTRCTTGGPAGTKAVLLILNTLTTTDGGCWPTMDDIAGYAEISRRQVQRGIRYLVDSGMLKYHEYGQMHSRVYRIQYQAVLDRSVNARDGGSS